MIYDPCYKYSRYAKEKYFKNPYCSILFLLAKDYLKENSKGTKDGDIKVKLIKEMGKMAER